MNNPFSKTTFDRKEKAVFLKRLAYLERGGLGIAESIQLIAFNEKIPKRKAALHKAAIQCESGVPLSLAFKTVSLGFTEFETSAIAIGETTASLSLTLEKVSETIQKLTEIREKVISVCTYPAL